MSARWGSVAANRKFLVCFAHRSAINTGEFQCGNQQYFIDYFKELGIDVAGIQTTASSVLNTVTNFGKTIISDPTFFVLVGGCIGAGYLATQYFDVNVDKQKVSVTPNQIIGGSIAAIALYSVYNVATYTQPSVVQGSNELSYCGVKLFTYIDRQAEFSVSYANSTTGYLVGPADVEAMYNLKKNQTGETRAQVMQKEFLSVVEYLHLPDGVTF
jgi:hypothetical protein